MNIGDLGSVKYIENLKAGAWFVFSSPKGRHLALLLPIPAGHAGIRFVELLNYSDEGALRAKLRTMGSDDFPAIAVFELSNIILDVPEEGVSWLHPSPTPSLVKRGALLVTEKGVGLITENKEGETTVIDLANLSTSSVGSSLSVATALITKWRLVRMANNVPREVCSINLE